jgi:CheY-like chemotaxis protein
VEDRPAGRRGHLGIQGGSLDIVICDIRLPDMTGEDVFRELAGGPIPRRSSSSPASATSTRRCA